MSSGKKNRDYPKFTLELLGTKQEFQSLVSETTKRNSDYMDSLVIVEKIIKSVCPDLFVSESVVSYQPNDCLGLKISGSIPKENTQMNSTDILECLLFPAAMNFQRKFDRTFEQPLNFEVVFPRNYTQSGLIERYRFNSHQDFS